MLGQRLVQERVVGRQEIQDAAVLTEDAVQEQLGFTHEGGAHALVEIAEQVHVRLLGFDVAQEQPLGGEVGHQGSAARIGQHAVHLPAQDVGLAQGSRGGRIQQLVVGDAGPEEEGEA